MLGRAVAVRADGSVRAPGTLSSHYAPRARVEVVDASDLVDRVHARELQRGARVGVLTPKLPHDLPPSAVVVGTPADPDEYARSLYRLLRAADDQRLDVVLAVAPPEVGIGAAVGDRLRRAAGARDA